jgi:cytochrome P450
VIEALVAAEAAGETLSEDEIVHTCLLVFNGGHETTTNLIAVGTHGLLSQPDRYRRMAHLDADEVPRAVEELIRYVSPLQLQGRRVNKPVELSAGTIEAGTEVILCQAAANRDERAFPDPDLIDLSRSPNPHVSFGLGLHACLGNQLARLEARSVFPKLARRLPELAETGTAIFSPNVRFRGLQTMPVEAGSPT